MTCPPYQHHDGIQDNPQAQAEDIFNVCIVVIASIGEALTLKLPTMNMKPIAFTNTRNKIKCHVILDECLL